MDETSARCFADGIVPELSVDGLAAAGLSLDDVRAGARPMLVPLTDGELDAMAAVLTECIDMGAEFAEAYGNLGGSQEGGDCLREFIDDDVSLWLAKRQFTLSASQEAARGRDPSFLNRAITDCYEQSPPGS